MTRPCGYPLCPALAVEDHEHCSVHSPTKIIERTKAIVRAEFTTVTDVVVAPLTLNLLINLRERILLNLDRTV